MIENEPLSYRESGVDIDEGDRLVKAIGPLASQTKRAECLDSIGGFGALFKVPVDRYKEPVLVSGTDGVGTKLLLARELNRHDTIGIDLVAMCVNDIIVQGAEPLFFLDYFATGRLDATLGASVIAGIAAGCKEAGAALIGGESAEMPGMYTDTDYDLAGFCVGVVEQAKIIDGPSAVKPGQAIIGLASSGPHSNGYSLIRRIVERFAAGGQTDPWQSRPFDAEQTLGESLLTPTRIYVRPLLELLTQTNVFGIAHITGGGITDNVTRVLGPGCHAVIDSSRWTRPPVFDWLKETGVVEESEMLRTFNCGIGMILIVDPVDVESAIASLKRSGEQAWEIGHVESIAGEPKVSVTRSVST